MKMKNDFLGCATSKERIKRLKGEIENSIRINRGMVHKCIVEVVLLSRNIEKRRKEKALLGQMWEGPGERLSIAFSGGIES